MALTPERLREIRRQACAGIYNDTSATTDILDLLDEVDRLTRLSIRPERPTLPYPDDAADNLLAMVRGGK